MQIYSMIRIVYFAFNDKLLHINKQETVATLTLAGMSVHICGSWIWDVENNILIPSTIKFGSKSKRGYNGQLFRIAPVVYLSI